MIVRPLDIASRLQRQPRDMDALFYFNGGLLALFFVLFGSRFVLAPGLHLKLPQLAGARQGGAATTAFISVLRSDEVFTDEGLMSLQQLHKWLSDKSKQSTKPSLLIRADKDVSVNTLSEITSAATAAGFVEVVMAADDPNASNILRQNR